MTFATQFPVWAVLAAVTITAAATYGIGRANSRRALDRTWTRGHDAGVTWERDHTERRMKNGWRLVMGPGERPQWIDYLEHGYLQLPGPGTPAAPAPQYGTEGRACSPAAGVPEPTPIYDTLAAPAALLAAGNAARAAADTARISPFEAEAPDVTVADDPPEQAPELADLRADARHAAGLAADTAEFRLRIDDARREWCERNGIAYEPIGWE